MSITLVAGPLGIGKTTWVDQFLADSDQPLVYSVPVPNDPLNFWRMPLTGQVFDPPSLEVLLAEITGGAYGPAIRLKGVFGLPDGQAFYIGFVEGMPGI